MCVCTSINFKGNFSWRLTAGNRFFVCNAQWPSASYKTMNNSTPRFKWNIYDRLSVLGHRCRSKEAKKLPTSDEEHIFAADTCGVANDIRLTLMQRFFKDVGSKTDQTGPISTHRHICFFTANDISSFCPPVRYWQLPNTMALGIDTKIKMLRSVVRSSNLVKKGFKGDSSRLDVFFSCEFYRAPVCSLCQ